MAAAVFVPLVIALNAKLETVGHETVVAFPLASVQSGALVPVIVPPVTNAVVFPV